MRRNLEIWLIKLAAWILDRNLQRCRYISRKHNNRIFNMVTDLEVIAEAMEDNYKTLRNE